MGRIAAAKHEQHAQERRDRILDAALRVFGHTGFAEATMDQVAAAADLSKAALYLYFSSKEVLLESLLNRYSLLPEMPAMLAALENTPPAAGIPALVAKAWGLLKARTELARVIVREIQGSPERAKIFAEHLGLPTYQSLAAYLDHWMEQGELRRQHPLAAAQCLFGMLWFFLLTQEVTGGRELFPLSDSVIVETISRMFLAGACEQKQPACNPPQITKPHGCI